MPCKKRDCKYHVQSAKEGSGHCNYIFVTGVSKHAQMPYGEKYKVEKCPFYDKGNHKYAQKVHPTITPNSNTTKKGVARIEEIENAVDFYNANLSDTDMSVLFGTTIQAVSAWRYKNGYNMKKENLSHIDWGDVQSMVDEGYSITAIAKYHRTKEFVILRYIDVKTRGIINAI